MKKPESQTYQLLPNEMEAPNKADNSEEGGEDVEEGARGTRGLNRIRQFTLSEGWGREVSGWGASLKHHLRTD